MVFGKDYILHPICKKSKKELNNIKKNEELNIFNKNVKILKISDVIHHKLTHQNLSIKFCYSDLDLDNQKMNLLKSS